MRPFARLRSATGRVYSHAAEFLAHVSKDEQQQRETMKGEQPHTLHQRRKERVRVKALKEFHDVRFMAAIFIAPIWRGRNTPPAVD
jgi:hypothetical protein